MISDAVAAAEWSLYWTSRGRPVPARVAPVLAGWADLDQREDALAVTRLDRPDMSRRA